MTSMTPFRPFSLLGWPSMMSAPGKSMEKDVDDFIRRFWDWRKEQNGIEWAPNIDVLEKPDAYLVCVEVPGLEKDDVHLDMSGDTLTIRGERKREETSEDDHYQVTECVCGRFQRTLTFPTALAKDGIDAELHNGILKIRLNKEKAATPTKIKIKST